MDPEQCNAIVNSMDDIGERLEKISERLKKLTVVLEELLEEENE